MKRQIVFRRIARSEFDEAYDWYEKKRRRIGEQFPERVQEVLDRIIPAPGIYPSVSKDVRRVT